MIDEDLLSFYETELKEIEGDSTAEEKDDDAPASAEGEIEIVREEPEINKTDQLDMEFGSAGDETVKEISPEKTGEIIDEEVEISDYEEKNYFEDIKEFAGGESGENNFGGDDLIEDDEFEEVPGENEEYKTPAEETFNRAKDLFDFLSDKDIDKIVQTVFNDDREDFASTMERVSECRNYDEATEILKSVFLTYRVNPYTRDAVTLTDAVSNYFQQD